MREYILRAIDQRIKIYGFSEHAPLFLDDGVRMLHSQIADYESETKALKAEFASQIEILLGYEADYLPSKMDDSLFDRKVDYFIGSVHYLNEWGFDNPAFIGEYAKKDLQVVWRDYFAAVRDMAETGLFDIVGHFDLIKVFGFFEDFGVDSSVIDALEAIQKAGMALEINTAGWRKKVACQYPSVEILREVKARKIPITFSSDAHAPNQVGFNLTRAYELAKELGFKEAVWFKDRKMVVEKI